MPQITIDKPELQNSLNELGMIRYFGQSIEADEFIREVDHQFHLKASAYTQYKGTPNNGQVNYSGVPHDLKQAHKTVIEEIKRQQQELQANNQVRQQQAPNPPAQPQSQPKLSAAEEERAINDEEKEKILRGLKAAKKDLKAKQRQLSRADAVGDPILRAIVSFIFGNNQGRAIKIIKERIENMTKQLRGLNEEFKNRDAIRGQGGADMFDPANKDVLIENLEKLPLNNLVADLPEDVRKEIHAELAKQASNGEFVLGEKKPHDIVEADSHHSHAVSGPSHRKF